LAEVTKKIGYPIAASAQGIQGEVVMKILIDEAGHYVKHLIVNKVDVLLSNIVEAHITELRWKPAIYRGKPIPYWVNIPFSFKIPAIEEVKMDKKDTKPKVKKQKKPKD